MIKYSAQNYNKKEKFEIISLSILLSKYSIDKNKSDNTAPCILSADQQISADKKIDESAVLISSAIALLENTSPISIDSHCSILNCA